MRATLAIALGITLLGCGPADPAPAPSSSSSSVATAPPPVSSVASSARPAPSDPPKRGDLPAKVTSAIRDNSSLGVFSNGAAVEVRLFVSKLTTKDPLNVALQVKLEKPISGGHPLLGETADLDVLLTSLRFELVTPGGSKVLQTTEKLGAGPINLTSLVLQLGIDGAGVDVRPVGKKLAWSAPAPDLFATPGRYTIAVSGQLKTTSSTLAIASKPLELEIVAPSADFKPLLDLALDAAELVKTRKSLAAAPESGTPVIDDTDHNRWFRHGLQPAGRGTGYDSEVVEVLLDPAGKEVNFDVFTHFNCVAQGVPIATPSGPVAVQALAVGDTVLAYDVGAGRKTTAIVQHVEVGHAEKLYAFGALRVTGAHPLMADGRFQDAAQLAPGALLFGEDLATFEAIPLVLDTPATVYEISVSAPHTYFAGGALVHNKARHNPIGGDAQPWRGWFYRRAVQR